MADGIRTDAGSATRVVGAGYRPAEPGRARCREDGPFGVQQ